MIRLILALSLMVGSGCATLTERDAAVGYYVGEWTFNGGFELWLQADGSYLWRQSLCYCGPDEHGNIGWSVDEQGTWSFDGQTIALSRRVSADDRSPATEYFARHRVFVVSGRRGGRTLVSRVANDLVTLKEAPEPKK